MLLVDLDRFKHINDSLGHPVGDRLLQSVVLRLLTCVRSSDTVGRQGGDEFVVLLQEVSHAQDAAITATKILEVLRKPHYIDEHELHVTASIGIATYPDDGTDVETLMKKVDLAMYQAKETGRNSYQFFESEIAARAIERQLVEDSFAARDRAAAVDIALPAQSLIWRPAESLTPRRSSDGATRSARDVSTIAET
jgi:diguanylate cyclase (GGDEF)-like protein